MNDDLVAALVRERFTKHRRQCEGHDDPVPDTDGWLHLKELREAISGKPDEEMEETA
jgi:hypothetical protein